VLWVLGLIFGLAASMYTQAPWGNPLHAVLGPKESEAGTVSVRHRTKGDLGPKPLRVVIESLTREVESKSISWNEAVQNRAQFQLSCHPYSVDPSGR
jgi:hypothetical protein